MYGLETYRLGNVSQRRVMKLVRSYAKDESGATAIEYGLLAALVGVMIIAGVRSTGDSINGVLGKAKAGLGTPSEPPPPAPPPQP